MRHSIFLPPALAPALVGSVLFLAGCVSDIPLAPGDKGPERPSLSLGALAGTPSDAQEGAVSPIALTYAQTAVTLEQADEAKLRALKETMAQALFDALPRNPGRQDRAASETVLTARPIPFGPDGPVGAFSCRTIKHGGPAPIVAYSYFDCEITETEEGSYLFRKTSGSQLMTGTLFSAPAFGADGRSALAYAGTQHGKGETAAVYPDGQREVGLFERIGEDRYRLLIPEPGEEGRLDVIDLSRR